MATEVALAFNAGQHVNLYALRSIERQRKRATAVFSFLTSSKNSPPFPFPSRARLIARVDEYVTKRLARSDGVRPCYIVVATMGPLDGILFCQSVWRSVCIVGLQQ